MEKKVVNWDGKGCWQWFATPSSWRGVTWVAPPWKVQLRTEQLRTELHGTELRGMKLHRTELHRTDQLPTEQPSAPLRTEQLSTGPCLVVTPPQQHSTGPCRVVGTLSSWDAIIIKSGKEKLSLFEEMLFQNKSPEQRLNLSRSRHKGLSHTYNT